jgi:hypothetical protein
MENATPTGPTHPEKKKGKGCKIALIILGVLFVIVVIVGYIVCTNIDKIADYAVTKSIDAFETKILENLPQGYDEAEVKETFDEVRRAYAEGELSGEELGPQLQVIGRSVQDAFEDEELTTEELDEILERMRDLTDSPSR